MKKGNKQHVRNFILTAAVCTAFMVGAQPLYAIKVTSVTLTGPEALICGGPKETYTCVIKGTGGTAGRTTMKYTVYDDDALNKDDALQGETSTGAVGASPWTVTVYFKLWCDGTWPKCKIRGKDKTSSENPAEVYVWIETSFWKFNLGESNTLKIFCFENLLGVTKATNLTPGGQDASRYAVLNWSPGALAMSHNVYFGTGFDDVNNANTSSPEYKGNYPIFINSYNPGPLDLGQTHFWRIDEINPIEANSPWTGYVNSFTVADYILVDDFQPYADTNDLIATWDPAGNAQVSLLADPCDGSGIAMKLIYDNSIFPYWSEAVKTYPTPQDWTIVDIKALRLGAYGDEGNDANEPIYVALEDADGNSAVVTDVNFDSTNRWAWQKSRIELQNYVDANSVDLERIKKVYIGIGKRDNPQAGGSGTVYFDDIRMYPSMCDGELVADFNGNCVVNFGDLAVLSDEWLEDKMWP